MFSPPLRFISIHGTPLIQGDDMDRMIDAVTEQFTDHTLRATSNPYALPMLTAMQLGTIDIARGRWGIGVEVKGETLGDFYMIYCLASGLTKFTQDNKSLMIEPGQIGLFNPWQFTTIAASADVESLTLQLPWSYVNDIWTALGGFSSMQPLQFDMKVPHNGALYLLLDKYFCELVNLEGTIDSPKTRAHFDSRFAQAITVAMLLHHPHNGRLLIQDRKQIRDKFVLSRALEQMDSNLEKNWGMLELSRACDVPYPSVLAAFVRYTGVGPKKWLTERRLHLARMQLRNPLEPTMTVVDTAQKFGFLTASNFSKIYFQQFGEAPSHTLRRGINRNFVTSELY